MLFRSIIFALQAASLPAFNQESWRGLFAGGFMRFATFLFFVSLFYHAWVGVRDIYMDYIKPTAVRLTLQVATIVLLFAYVIWAANILWSI